MPKFDVGSGLEGYDIRLGLYMWTRTSSIIDNNHRSEELYSAIWWFSASA